MRVLHLAYRDTSGVPGRWAAAHRAHGHEAKLIVEYPHPFEYGAPATACRWSPEGPAIISGALRWADAIMAYDHPVYLHTAIETRKPVLFRALGQSSREFADEIRDLLKSPNVVRATAGTADLALALDVELVGAPYTVVAPAPFVSKSVLCHAPSDREAKGTKRVLRAGAAAGWDVDLVEAATNEETLRRKRSAAVLVDCCGPGTVPDGYGVNAVEAMALGIPAVSSASAPVAAALARVGSPVVLVEDEDALVQALRHMKDVDVRKALRRRGREFVRRFHAASARVCEDMLAVAA